MIELLRRFGGKFRRYMVIGPACKLIEVIFDLLTPLVIAQMIDKGIGAHDVNAVVHYGMLLGAMAVIGISFTLVCQKMAALTSQGMGTDIRGALYGHINKLSYAELGSLWHAVAHHAHHQRRQSGAARRGAGRAHAYPLAFPGGGLHGCGPRHRP